MHSHLYFPRVTDQHISSWETRSSPRWESSTIMISCTHAIPRAFATANAVINYATNPYPVASSTFIHPHIQNHHHSHWGPSHCLHDNEGCVRTRNPSPTTRPEGYMTIAPTRFTRPEGYMLTIICIHVAQFSPEGCTTAAHGITYYPSTQTLNTSHPCRSCTHLHNSTSPCLGGYAPPLLYITHSVYTTPQSNRRP